MTNSVREPLFHIVKRGQIPLWKAIVTRTAGIVLGFILCAVLCALFSSANAFEVLGYLFDGALGSERRIWLLLRETMLLLGVGLALVPAFKMKYWNLGGNGQILMGALVAVAIMRSDLATSSPAVANILMVVCSILVGAVWAVIPAIFKAFFNTNESLFTLMMNYIAVGLVSFFISKWATSGSGTLGQIASGHLPEIVNTHLLTIITVAIITALMFVYMRFTKHGYELSVVGESEKTAKYVGISVKKVVIRTLALSGAICGIVGLLLAGSIDHSINESTAQNMGFTAIMVVWLGKNNPLLMILSSLFIAFFSSGMDRGVISSCGFRNDAVSNLVLGVVYFCVIGCEFFITYKLKFRSKKTAKITNDFMASENSDDQKPEKEDK